MNLLPDPISYKASILKIIASVLTLILLLSPLIGTYTKFTAADIVTVVLWLAAMLGIELPHLAAMKRETKANVVEALNTDPAHVSTAKLEELGVTRKEMNAEPKS